jgi:hypothetical protein
MTAKSLPFNIFLIITILLVLFSCKTTADFQIKQIPQPPPTAKVRIFVLMISGIANWRITHPIWARTYGKMLAKQFSQTDIYDVIPYEELSRVISEEAADWEWERKDWDLAKHVGRALHAEYVLVSYRRLISGATGEVRSILINLETGKKIEISYVLSGEVAVWEKVYRDSRVEIFNRTKAELLALALSKERLVTTPTFETPVSTLPPTPTMEKPVIKEPTEIKPPTVPPKVEVAKPSPVVKKKDIKKVSEPEPPIIAPKIEIAKVIPPVERLVIRKSPKAESPGIDSKPHKAKTEPPVVGKSIDKKPPPIEPPVAAPKLELAKATPVVEKPIVKEISVIAPPIKKSDVPKSEGKRKIVVYDIETSDQLKVVGLILSEAARQEFLTTGQYSLINRENINLIMDEHKLRGSGLIDDRKASALGNWMSADEAVTGKLSLLGNTLVLQLKMININTVETLSLGSMHGSVGKEVEMIREMSSLVKQLVERRK